MPGKKSKAFIGLMIGLMIAGILLGPLNTAIASNTGAQSVTNESVTVALDEDVDLDGWQVQSGTVTVRKGTTGQVVPQSGNYTVALEPGTINVSSSNTASLSDGDMIHVTYDYAATDATATLIAGFIVTLVLVVMIWYPVNWIQEHY
jgi:tetrahydromethanopterin S-methyltransferase subunit F